MGTMAARVHVLLARDAPFGVVIRRGPSKEVAVIGWNRNTDQFTLGQWLKGRIYERRCDLSPDGKHLIYFAMNGKWESETKGSWTAISKAPYLKAVGLWAKGDCWHGGGLFMENDQYWINDGYGHRELKIPWDLVRVSSELEGGVGGECFSVYFPRLLRDGWTLAAEPDSADDNSGTWRFEKVTRAGWTLRKHVHSSSYRQQGKGCYYDTHQLIRANDGTTIDHPTWEWADFEGRRLMWSEFGKLFVATLEPTGVGDVREVYDFDSMKFEAVAAPY